MQSYLLQITANGSRTFSVDGVMFVYESGAGVPGTGDDRIVVKPDNGAEMVLRPGQRVRNTQRTQNWYVRPYDPNVGITGAVVIGNGDFGDAAIGKFFRLDGAFQNNVTINNTPANRIPITIDEGQIQKISGGIVSYTNSFSYNLPTGAGSAVKVLDAAANVNGVIIARARMRGTMGGSAGVLAMVAKAGSVAPATVADGDPLVYSPNPASSTFDLVQNLATEGQIRIPPGRSVWILTEAITVAFSVQILYLIQ